LFPIFLWWNAFDVFKYSRKIIAVGITAAICHLGYGKVGFPQYFFCVCNTHIGNVFVNTDPFATGHIITSFTEEEYAQLFIANSKYSDCKVEKAGDLTYFVINEETEDATFTHYTYFYKSESAYWLVEFALEQSKVNKYADDIFKWAGSVKFN
jgi:hypothetical protein